MHLWKRAEINTLRMTFWINVARSLQQAFVQRVMMFVYVMSQCTVEVLAAFRGLVVSQRACKDAFPDKYHAD